MSTQSHLPLLDARARLPQLPATTLSFTARPHNRKTPQRQRYCRYSYTGRHLPDAALPLSLHSQPCASSDARRSTSVGTLCTQRCPSFPDLNTYARSLPPASASILCRPNKTTPCRSLTLLASGEQPACPHHYAHTPSRLYPTRAQSML